MVVAVVFGSEAEQAPALVAEREAGDAVDGCVDVLDGVAEFMLEGLQALVHKLATKDARRGHCQGGGQPRAWATPMALRKPSS